MTTEQQEVTVPAQQPKNPEPTDFDIRAFALEKAVNTHGYSSMSDQRPSALEVVEAAEAYRAFLSGEQIDNEKE